MDSAAAIADLTERAAAGDAAAQYALADRHETGEGIAQDFAAALRLFGAAAEQGHAAAQWRLGTILSPMGKAESYGIAPDSLAALRWLEAAAGQNHADAMTLVAYAYEFGLGTAVNPAVAARWWRRLAEQGDADALHRLGTISLNSGLKPQAAHWFRRAAERGDALALRYLRDLAAEGVAEAAIDPAVELRILETAAGAGDSVALEALGLRYAEGDGVARDPDRAIAHLRRAAAEEEANGRSGTATSALRRVEASLGGRSPGE